MIVRVRSLCTAAAVSVLAAACVTVYDDAEADEPGSLELPAYAVAQTIPLGKSGSSPEERLLLQFYGGVLERLQEAADDHDSAALFGLLEAYDKPNLPEWLAGRLRGYRALGHGLAFLEHAASDSRLTLVTDPAAGAAGDAAAIAPAIGAPVHFEFSLPAGPRPVRLGGRAGDDPIGFAIAITIDDLYVDGGSRTQSDQDFQWLDEAFPLDEGAVLRLPLSFAIPVGKAVRRRTAKGSVQAAASPPGPTLRRGSTSHSGRTAPAAQHRPHSTGPTASSWAAAHPVLAVCTRAHDAGRAPAAGSCWAHPFSARIPHICRPAFGWASRGVGSCCVRAYSSGWCTPRAARCAPLYSGCGRGLGRRCTQHCIQRKMRKK